MHVVFHVKDTAVWWKKGNQKSLGNDQRNGKLDSGKKVHFQTSSTLAAPDGSDDQADASSFASEDGSESTSSSDFKIWEDLNDACYGFCHISGDRQILFRRTLASLGADKAEQQQCNSSVASLSKEESTQHYWDKAHLSRNIPYSSLGVCQLIGWRQVCVSVVYLGASILDKLVWPVWSVSVGEQFLLWSEWANQLQRMWLFKILKCFLSRWTSFGTYHNTLLKIVFTW